MRGTEKQIKWAEEIQKNVINTYEAYLSGLKEHCNDKELMAQNLAWVEPRLKAVREAEYAGDIIHLFGCIRFKGDLAKDIFEIRATYGCVPTTEGERKILCK